MLSVSNYRGRFAPSPTGPLHFGSLVAALASYLDARVQDGEWLVRIEDLDGAREQPGAAQEILNTLAAYGFRWDGEVVYQSQRTEHYEKAFAYLQAQDLVYPCACSRREIADSTLTASGQHVYPGTCRKGLPTSRRARSWRLRVPAEAIGFNDRVSGYYSQDLAAVVGDFVVARADGCWAYQLAVVVDDFLQGITDVVRGADLLASTPRQIYLQRCLGYSPLRYQHIPVVTDVAGEKLSKQTRAPALASDDPLPSLCAAMRFLGYVPAKEATSALPAFWAWAQAVWLNEKVAD